MVKNLPVVQETQVRSLGQEDPLKEEMATHSSVFAWEIPWTEEPTGLQSMVSQSHDLVTKQQQQIYNTVKLTDIPPAPHPLNQHAFISKILQVLFGVLVAEFHPPLQ